MIRNVIRNVTMDAAEQDLVELESLVRAQSKDNLVENEVK